MLQELHVLSNRSSLCFVSQQEPFLKVAITFSNISKIFALIAIQMFFIIFKYNLEVALSIIFSLSINYLLHHTSLPILSFTDSPTVFMDDIRIVPTRRCLKQKCSFFLLKHELRVQQFNTCKSVTWTFQIFFIMKTNCCTFSSKYMNQNIPNGQRKVCLYKDNLTQIGNFR